MKFGFNRPVVSEEKMFENIDNTHTYIRTTEAYLSYKLTTEPKGSAQLKIGECNAISFLPLYV